MICFEVVLNGKKLAVAGCKDGGVAAVHVVHGRKKSARSPDRLRISVSGLEGKREPYASLLWAEHKLCAGDQIQIRVLQEGRPTRCRRTSWPEQSAAKKIKSYRETIYWATRELRKLEKPRPAR